MAINWLDESVIMLRIIIGDVACEPENTDQQLKELLVTAARLTQFELPSKFKNTYAISVRNLTVAPDPLEQDDQDFITLATLRGACIADQGQFRARALMEGIRVSCGPGSLSVSGNLKGFETLIKEGPCKTYKEAINQYLFGNRDYVRGILSPFVSNSFQPESLPYFRNSGNGSYRFNY